MVIEKDDFTMDLMMEGESGSGLGSILDFCAGAAALLLGFVIAAVLPPVTLAVLRKKYNQADGKPDRSVKEMLHAHKGAAKLCMLHKAVFVIAGALVWGMAFAEQALHLLVEGTPPVQHTGRHLVGGGLCADGVRHDADDRRHSRRRTRKKSRSRRWPYSTVIRFAIIQTTPCRRQAAGKDAL